MHDAEQELKAITQLHKLCFDYESKMDKFDVIPIISSLAYAYGLFS